MLISTKVVWNIDCTVTLNLLFWQFILAVLMNFKIVHSIFNGVVMTFVMNIGDNLHWLSLRCCCLYFEWNLPLLLCFFLSKVIVLANY